MDRLEIDLLEIASNPFGDRASALIVNTARLIPSGEPLKTSREGGELAAWLLRTVTEFERFAESGVRATIVLERGSAPQTDDEVCK